MLYLWLGLSHFRSETCCGFISFCSSLGDSPTRHTTTLGFYPFLLHLTARLCLSAPTFTEGSTCHCVPIGGASDINQALISMETLRNTQRLNKLASTLWKSHHHWCMMRHTSACQYLHCVSSINE